MDFLKRPPNFKLGRLCSKGAPLSGTQVQQQVGPIITTAAPPVAVVTENKGSPPPYDQALLLQQQQHTVGGTRIWRAQAGSLSPVKYRWW